MGFRGKSEEYDVLGSKIRTQIYRISSRSNAPALECILMVLEDAFPRRRVGTRKNIGMLNNYVISG